MADDISRACSSETQAGQLTQNAKHGLEATRVQPQPLAVRFAERKCNDASLSFVGEAASAESGAGSDSGNPQAPMGALTIMRIGGVRMSVI